MLDAGVFSETEERAWTQQKRPFTPSAEGSSVKACDWTGEWVQGALQLLMNRYG